MCLDKTIWDRFDSIGEVYAYFQNRWGTRLTDGQPHLHLPAEVAHLTGKDEDWEREPGFLQQLWKDMRMAPGPH